MGRMYEHGLDTLEHTNNSAVQYMNRRVDTIRESVGAAMHDEGMMEFAGMALGFPLLGLGLTMLGAPPAVLALGAVAAPMSLLMHLTNGRQTPDHPDEHHFFHINLTLPINDEEYDY